MNQFCEKLEGRDLFSATTATIFADLIQVSKDATQLQRDLRSYMPAIQADLKTVFVDLKKQPNFKANLPLFTKLLRDEVKCVVTLGGDFAQIMKAETAGMNRVITDAFKLMAKPADPTLQAKLGTDIAGAQAAAVAPTTKFVNDLIGFATTLTADMTALTDANPTATQLAADLQSMQAHGAIVGQNLQTHFTTAQTDLAKLLTDLTS